MPGGGGKLQIHEMNIKIDTVIVVLSDYGSEDITILGNGRAFISAVSIWVEEQPSVGLNKRVITLIENNSEKFVHH